MCTFYIIKSQSLDKFYVGYTCDTMSERLRKHNSNHKGFTGKENDWMVVYSEALEDKKAAYAREREVKALKSIKKIMSLAQLI